MNKMAATTVDSAVCVVCMQETNDDGHPEQLRSFYQDLVEMAESEIDFRCSGDLRFPASKVNFNEQSAGGLRPSVSIPDIVLAIAADSSIMKDTAASVDVLEFFAGTAGISKAMKQQGFMVGPPIDIATGYDLNAEAGQAKAWELMVDLGNNHADGGLHNGDCHLSARGGSLLHD